MCIGHTFGYLQTLLPCGLGVGTPSSVYSNKVPIVLEDKLKVARGAGSWHTIQCVLQQGTYSTRKQAKGRGPHQIME